MTEELEKKLDELLGLKKQLEEMTAEKSKDITSSVLRQYKKKLRSNFIRFCVAVAIGFIICSFGWLIYTRTTDVVYIRCPIIMSAGIGLIVFAKLCWLIRQSKLSILQEMKEFELRIMEMLKK
jgi:hypothetical protein